MGIEIIGGGGLNLGPRRGGGLRFLNNVGVTYLLRDLFADDRAAGAVNGTLATDGVHTRVGTDATSKMSITSGQIAFNGGNASYTNLKLYYTPGIARVAQRVLQFDITLPDNTHHLRVGWSIDGTDSNAGAMLHFAGDGNLLYRVNAGAASQIVPFTAGTYQVRQILLSPGCETWLKGGAFAVWTKVHIWLADSAATLYPMIVNYNSSNTLDNVLVYDRYIDQTMLGARVGGFTKLGNVLPRRVGKWDECVTREINIVTDENGNKVTDGGVITAHYWGRPTSSGTMSIGIATSSDNGATWGGRQDTPLISPSGVVGSWYRNNISQASTIKRTSDGLLMMLANGDAGIGLLTSPDGVNWTDGGVKFSDANIAASGYAGTAAPSVIKRSVQGDYICLYEALHATFGWGIFGATSPDFVGTWTVMNGGQPLMARSGIGFKSTGVSNPHPVEITPGNFLVAYTGFGWASDRRVSFATTTDFLTWNDYQDEFVLMHDSTAWDAATVESSFLDKDSYPSLRLYYHGFESYALGTISIGLAVS